MTDEGRRIAVGGATDQAAPKSVVLRDAKKLGPTELAPLLALNNAHATELSFVALDRLSRLLDAAWLALAAGDGQALLVAFDQDSAYQGTNFLWFRERFPRFAYVDRVVVAPGARGRGIARALYGATVARAAADGLGRICCEVNVDPPNPASDAFHAALGFGEVGRGTLGSGKVVRYLARSVPPATWPTSLPNKDPTRRGRG